MKICIIVEGSYPYVTGGVSSWVQTLISSFPEHEFIIYAIGAQEKNRGKFKYKLPDNIIYVKEIFLDSYLNEAGMRGKKFNISKDEETAIKSLICGEDFQWKHIFNFVFNNKDKTVSDFLLSKDCFRIISDTAEEKYPYIAFNDFFWTIRSMLLTLFGVIKNGVPEADIYHTVSTGYAGIAASIGKYLYDAPVLLTEHGIYTREREEEIIKADWVKGYFKDTWINYFYNLSRCIYSYSDIVVSLFERNREIQIELGCEREKTRVIPNGIDTEIFRDSRKVRKESKYINIGTILRVVPIKDIKTIIQGFAVACHQIKNIKLYIIGPTDEDESYFNECGMLIESLGIFNNVIFTGSVNVREYIGGMDILILGSISEGMPLAVLEGMAAEKPHILTDVGSCRELMYGNGDEYGEVGIIIPVMDYQALGKSILKLSKNKELRERMGKYAYMRVREHYTLKGFIESYKNIYMELMEIKNGRSRI